MTGRKARNDGMEAGGPVAELMLRERKARNDGEEGLKYDVEEAGWARGRNDVVGGEGLK